MGTISMWTMRDDELGDVLTQGQKVFISWLERHNYLTNKQADELRLETCVMIKKPSLINSWYKTLLGKVADEPSIFIARIDKLALECVENQNNPVAKSNIKKDKVETDK